MVHDVFTYALSLDGKEWDRQVLSLGYAHPYQSRAFGEAQRIKGWNTWRVQISLKDQLIGTCTVQVNRDRVANWMYGPSVIKAYVPQYGSVVNELLVFLKKSGVIGIDYASTRIPYDDPDFSVAENLEWQTGQTPVIDLGESEEEMHHPAVRKKVKKCERERVEFFFGDEESLLPEYLSMLESHRRRLGFGMPPFFPNLETRSCFLGHETGMYVALAKCRGEGLAGLGFATFGKVAIQLATAQSEAYLTANLPAQDYITVMAARMLRQKGIRFYDLSGIQSHSPSKKEENIRNFKMKFAKTVKEYQFLRTRDLVRPAYWAFRIKRKLKILTGFE